MAMILNSPTPTQGLVNTLRFKVLQSNHDGHANENSSSLNTTFGQIMANHSNSTNYNWQSYALLTAETIGLIPQGTTIDKATLHAVAGNTRTNSPTSKMSFELSDNPALPSNRADLRARTRGSILSYTPPNNTYTDNQAIEIDMTSRVQTMINRSDWQCNKLLWLWDWNAAFDETNTFVSFKSYDAGANLALYLIVEW